MRDSAIIAMEAENAKRAGLLFVQFEYLKTRQEAIEDVELTATLWQRVVFFFEPAAKWRVIDAVQNDKLKQADKEMEAAQQRRKIQLAPASAMPKAAAGAHGG